jgi:hypothetical protein
MSDDQTINLERPQCHQRLDVPAAMAGKMIWCPDCEKAIEVPSPFGISEQARLPHYREPSPKTTDDAWPSHGDGHPEGRSRRRPRASIHHDAIPPAICMLVVASFGLLFNLIGVALDLGPEQPVDPQLPVLLRELSRTGRGPLYASVLAFFALLSGFTMFGSIQMIRGKTWGICLAASVISIVNFGNWCCLLGLPFGIWALVTLVKPDVRESFS